MARRGRKRRLELESQYWELLLSGVGTFNACEIVGIGRKTGYRWRAENGGLPPARLAETARSGRYLSLLERQRIATLHARGLGVRAIADRLGRAPSTVSRELRRNQRPHDRGIYDGDLAHARERARRPRRGRLLEGTGLRDQVQAKLELEWSPEQIAAWLRRAYPDKPGWHVCHGDDLPGHLSRWQRWPEPAAQRPAAHRPPAAQAPPQRQAAQDPVHRPGRADIDARPAIVQRRQRVGDWEGDLITGRSNKSAIGTLADRTSRYVRLVHLPAGHDADAVRDGMLAILTGLPETARLSLTWDQGSEMACHDQLAPLLADGVFFTHPASPWQRGTNENTNGLLRQYFRKGSDLSRHTAQDLRAVEHRLNHRPRKTLGWRTPAEIFTATLSS